MITEDEDHKPELEFLFKRPDTVESLSRAANLSIAMGAIASRLALEERARCVHPDGRPENDSEHSHMLAKVSIYLVKELYPKLDAGKVAIYSVLHDDTEAWVGDTPTDTISAEGLRTKAIRETQGLEQLEAEYGNITPSYVDDMKRYEAQVEPEARFARLVDKLMTLLIQVADGGKTLRESYTKEEYISNTKATYERFSKEYPDFIELVELRRELAYYLAELYY